MAKTESRNQLQKGDEAPDFALRDMVGVTHERNALLGKEGTFVVFICNHCPYVKARIGEVVSLYEEFGGPIGFIAINPCDPEYPGEGIDASAEFARERGITFPYLYDESGVVAKAYGASCTPDPFLFDRDLKLVFHGKLVDALEPSEPVAKRTMHDAMTKLRAGEAIEPWFDPSVGCSIKFKGE